MLLQMPSQGLAWCHLSAPVPMLIQVRIIASPIEVLYFARNQNQLGILILFLSSRKAKSTQLFRISTQYGGEKHSSRRSC
jgi:hypothetical protein